MSLQSDEEEGGSFPSVDKESGRRQRPANWNSVCLSHGCFIDADADADADDAVA